MNRLLMLRGMLHVMRMPAGDDGGDGGGGGDGKGGAGDAPLTRDEVNKMINGAVSGAVANVIKRVEAKIPSVESLGTMLDEKLKGYKPAGSDDGSGEGGGSKKKESPVSAEIQQTLARQTAEIERLKKQNDDERKAREESERKARSTEERTELTNQLAKGGVPPHLIKVLVPYLHNESGKVARNDKGEIVFKMKRDWGDEDLSLEKGVAEWLGTDEGKGYLPPKKVGGAGSTQGGPPGRTPKGDATLRDLGEILMAGMQGQGGGDEA